MSSFSISLWLAVVFVVMTAGLSTAAVCTSNGLSVRCNSRVTCEHYASSIRCYGGEVIRIHSANFGRHHRGICTNRRPSYQLQNVYCSAPSAAYTMAKLCDGKSSCYVRASTSTFGDPCYGTYKYLHVNYFCEPRKVVCENHNARLVCPAGKVIRVHGANYGRHDTYTCSSGIPYSQRRNTYCTSFTTTHLLSRLCNGKNKCHVTPSNSLFGDTCYGTYKYMQVSFYCI